MLIGISKDVRPIRRAHLDPKQHLDDQIEYLVAEVPIKISDAVKVIENIQQFKIFKRVAQGWSIVVGSWLEIFSDILIFNRTKNHFGGMTTIYNYGVKGFYGVGFGFPLLLGLPESDLDCNEEDFYLLTSKYRLANGLKDLMASGIPVPAIQSVISEFEIIIRAQLGCILEFDGEIPEAADVTFILDDLITAMQLRLGIEDEGE